MDEMLPMNRALTNEECVPDDRRVSRQVELCV